MKVSELTRILKVKQVAGTQLDTVITGGYCSDLLSDVMGNANEGDIWITMQAHKNILAVAALKDIAAIIIIGGHKPSDDTIAHANTEGVNVFTCDETAFTVCGKLYAEL